ncbi:MAG TPA: class I SAM-dependent methyltransferase [Luteibacter sp.]|uniref:class I SAM-dependent methyltransferase n=1 Tax=Luteibacter sp. TaxID=1886636 RepID=UPI002C943D86|nr:class I SAM-dependent methyltransferase [Luteibacter sp.]HVI56276.1 class I SAM-dependent methyltransferase [Luteibacter sp.]
MLLYSIVRRERPSVVVELGTGMGVTSAWIAAAMRENGHGTLYTYDNGAHYARPKVREFLQEMPSPLHGLAAIAEDGSYPEFLAKLFADAGVEDHVRFTQGDMNMETVRKDLQGRTVDIVFSDFDHAAPMVQRVISAFLPLLSDTASIFIDSASTHLPAYHALELLTAKLNQGRLPKGMAEILDEEDESRARALVSRSEFRLMHLIEAADRKQNSTAWLRMEPSDMVPSLTTFFH